MVSGCACVHRKKTSNQNGECENKDVDDLFCNNAKQNRCKEKTVYCNGIGNGNIA